MDIIIFFALCLTAVEGFILPTLPNNVWTEINIRLKARLDPLHSSLSSDVISTSAAAERFSSLMNDFLSSEPVFNHKGDKSGGKKKRQQNIDISDEAFILAKTEKKRLRRLVVGKRQVDIEIRRLFYQSIKTYSFIKKLREKQKRKNDAEAQERSLFKNFWSFAKRAVEGTVGADVKGPTFTFDDANKFYRDRYSTPAPLVEDAISWFPTIPVPVIKDFDMSPIRPRDVRNTLHSKRATSAPGDDGILNGHMKHLDATHHFLATLFSKLLLKTPEPWDGWGDSRICLIHKQGDTSDPSNFRPIALTSTVGKLFHQILANRMSQFLVLNGLIDSSTQKAFLSGISGCQDHNLIMQEILNHCKSNRKTVHVTWFDLEDAFGSVPHDLIPTALGRMHLPDNVRTYVSSLYSKLRGKVRTKNFVSNNFNFKKGVFQGDPLSPLIFLICFNPIIEELKKSENFGYDLDGMKYITLPFADDFNLITTHKGRHQKLINKLHVLTSSMGLKLKPRKCKSLSICAGKSTEIQFQLNNNALKSILDDKYHKFLGGLYTFDNTSKSKAGIIYDVFYNGLENIDALLIRNELKVRIYSEYFLGSKRFLFSIHDLHSSQISEIENLTHRYIKKWLGIPRSGSWCLVHDRHGINIKSISHFYKECRTVSLINIRQFSDARVRHALDTKEARESKWKRKSSPAMLALDVGNSLSTSAQPTFTTPTSSPPNFAPSTPIPPASPTIATHSEVLNPLLDTTFSSVSSDEETASNNLIAAPLKKRHIRHAAQKHIQECEDAYWRDKISKLIMQGDFLNLLIEEDSNVTWKSYLWGLPRGVVKFAVNSGLNTLPSADNLKRWGKRTSDICKICSGAGKQTLHHILSSCSVSLEQGRYTFRHDSCLMTIVNFVKNSLLTNLKLYSDLIGCGAGGGNTIPPHIITTSQRPDLVIVNEEEKHITLFELSVPWDNNIDNAHTFKNNKYASLVIDLESAGFSVNLFCIEISVRGQITKPNKSRLKTFLFKTTNCKRSSLPPFLNNISKAALLGSFSIFNARNELCWGISTVLPVRM